MATPEISFRNTSNTDFASYDNNIVNLTAKQCIIECVVKIKNKETTSYEICGEEDLSWIIVREGFVINNNETIPVIKFYISDNYTNQTRYAYLDIKDNNTGDTSSITFIQEACQFEIDGAPLNITVMERNRGEQTPFYVIVKGASKTISIYNQTYNDKDIVIAKNEINILSEIVSKSIDDDAIRYKVTPIFHGVVSANTNCYRIFICHNDEPTCVKEIYVVYKKETIEENGIIDNFNDVYGTQTSSCVTHREKNLELLQNSSVPVTVTYNEEEEVEPARVAARQVSFIPITFSGFNENTSEITIKTKNAKDDEDSQIVVTSYALWCKCITRHEEYTENGITHIKHIITVTCEDNFWNNNRYSKILIRNAEVISGILWLQITQHSDNTISISEITN